jgi:hypothetical protein
VSSIDNNFAEQFRIIAESMTEWNAARSRYESLVTALESLGSEPTFGANYLYASISGDKDKLVQVIRLLRTSGLVADDDKKPAEKQPLFQAWYRNAADDVRVYLSFSSTVCKRVQVGTETKEVPVYETVCE